MIIGKLSASQIVRFNLQAFVNSNKKTQQVYIYTSADTELGTEKSVRTNKSLFFFFKFHTGDKCRAQTSFSHLLNEDNTCLSWLLKENNVITQHSVQPLIHILTKQEQVLLQPLRHLYFYNNSHPKIKILRVTYFSIFYISIHMGKETLQITYL